MSRLLVILPQKAKLINPDRFIMMFAPITRLFNESYAEKHDGTVTEPYNRNKNIWPDTPHKNLMYLEEWRKTFSGETFVFIWEIIFNSIKSGTAAMIQD